MTCIVNTLKYIEMFANYSDSTGTRITTIFIKSSLSLSNIIVSIKISITFEKRKYEIKNFWLTED